MLKNSSIEFIQPRHTYAPETGDGHIHLSAPMITAMAQIESSNGNTSHLTYRDENFENQRGPINADIIGINLVGAPYIPEAITIIHRVREGATVLLGGQIIDSLGEDFDRLFSNIRPDITVVNGNRGEVLEKVLNITQIPPPEKVSSIPIWEQISDEQMKQYLNHPMSFYVSQGCKYFCTFCQAAKGRPEVYRDLDIAHDDLLWIAEKAQSFGIHALDIYFSNLDIFQKPHMLEQFADKILSIKEQTGISFTLRGLATVHSMLHIPEEVVFKMRRAGLTTIGLGVDGGTAAVWKKTGKIHNMSPEEIDESQKCIDAVRRCYELGLTPEVLLVFGHDIGNLDESLADLEASLEFIKDMIRLYKVIPRAHVVKTLLPGATGWKKGKNKERRDFLLDNPTYFQTLDYTALPSELSHPDPVLRSFVSEYYHKVCALMPDMATKIIYPNTPETQQYAASIGTTVEKLNEGQYDR